MAQIIFSLTFCFLLTACSVLTVNREIASDETDCMKLATGFFKTPSTQLKYESAEIDAIGTSLADRFPDLAFALRDRDLFIKNMRARFDKQKLITPENPHLFDYTELGMPALKTMHDGLLDQRGGLEMIIFSASRGHNPDKFDIEELKILLQLVKDLQHDIALARSKGTITYFESLKISNYYVRSAGMYHTIAHTGLQKAQLKFDRYLEGYRPLKAKEEYDLYKENRFFVFQDELKSGIGGYREAEPLFEGAILDKNELRAIIIPTGDAIDREVLNYLFSRDNMYVGGLSTSPIQADGFFRTSGDFWYHDLRHESAKFYEKSLYVKQFGISRKNIPQLDRQLDQWMLELKVLAKSIKDEDLRDAVELTCFNFHHDSGYPMIPSIFLEKYSLSKTSTFYFSLKVGGEKTFKNPKKNLSKAKDILEEFWKKRQVEEQKLLVTIAPAI